MTKKRATKAAPAPLVTREVTPFPCDSLGCPGHLVAVNKSGLEIDRDKEGVHRWICSVEICEARRGVWMHESHSSTEIERCPADGAPLTFDPTLVGKTCGGLRLRGWNRCAHCGGTWITRKGAPDHGGGDDGRWTVATSGRSLDVGDMRLRVDGKSKGKGDVAALMQRIARVPTMEAALRAIAEGADLTAMRDLARAALDSSAMDVTGNDGEDDKQDED